MIGNYFRWSFSPTPLLKHGDLQQIDHDYVQMILEVLHRWKPHSLSEKTVPTLGHLHNTEVFPGVQKEQPLFHFVSILFFSWLWAPPKRAWLHLFCILPSGIYIHVSDTLRLLFSMLNYLSSLSLTSSERYSSPFIILVPLHWTLSSMSRSLL